MKLNNRGFAISSILYMALVLFFIIIIALLAMMGGRKNILDKVRKDTYNFINGIVGSGTDSDETLDIAFPTMSDNMIPIVYSPTGITLKADTTGNTNRNWYNYSQRKWANVVLVKENGFKTREYYKSAAPGTIISSNDILAYFVWIPRYSYAIDSFNKIININFENKTQDPKTGDGIGENYYTHPAFATGGLNLNGIWIGKFATSGDSAGNFDDEHTGITVLPGKEALINLSAKEMFWNSRKMEMYGNLYGFSTSSTTYFNSNGNQEPMDNNRTDSHVLKSTEYGALILLSQSKYGKNSDVDKYYDTGVPYTGGGTGNDYLINTSQSTTGNIYGVYDVVSSNGELVMGYNHLLSGVSTIYFNSYGSWTERYENGVVVNMNIPAIQGDATIENNNLSPWQTLSIDHYQVIAEGQYYLRGKDSVFSYSGTTGSSGSNVGFRISLAIWE